MLQVFLKTMVACLASRGVNRNQNEAPYPCLGVLYPKIKARLIGSRISPTTEQVKGRSGKIQWPFVIDSVLPAMFKPINVCPLKIGPADPWCPLQQVPYRQRLNPIGERMGHNPCPWTSTLASGITDPVWTR